jgi:hypothetical protein
MFVLTKEIYKVIDEELKLIGKAGNYKIEIDLNRHKEFILNEDLDYLLDTYLLNTIL